jgi:hypothetical protein
MMIVESINGFQRGLVVIRPSDDKISAEILYNKFDILLPYWYLSFYFDAALPLYKSLKRLN